MDSIKTKFKFIFRESLQDLEQENYDAYIFKDHIEYIDHKNYNTYYKPIKEKEKLPLIVRDYIAGMSDMYFNEIYRLLKKRYI